MLIKLKVHADSKSSSIAKKSENSFEVWVRAPAKNGLANKSALNLLAQALNQNVKRLHIIKGSQTPSKIVKLFQ